MSIQISEPYHRQRLLELELTVDYLVKQEEEKDRIHAERERQKEEEAARRDFEREKARLQKEQSHYVTALASLQANGDSADAAEIQQRLDKVTEALADVDRRAANVRAGYVYVISNVGSFGKDMIKIGMTRRLDPRDRVRELGDASVPFKFDVHAFIVPLRTATHGDQHSRSRSTQLGLVLCRTVPNSTAVSVAREGTLWRFAMIASANWRSVWTSAHAPGGRPSLPAGRLGWRSRLASGYTGCQDHTR
jgi:T5orf172 domain